MCGACGGVGTVRNERLSEVLAVVVGHGGWMTTTEIAERTGLATTNTASLCARLRRLGHIVRRGQRGRVGYEWRAGDEAQLSADRARARARKGVRR